MSKLKTDIHLNVSFGPAALISTGPSSASLSRAGKRRTGRLPTSQVANVSGTSRFFPLKIETAAREQRRKIICLKSRTEMPAIGGVGGQYALLTRLVRHIVAGKLMSSEEYQLGSAPTSPDEGGHRANNDNGNSAVRRDGSCALGICANHANCAGDYANYRRRDQAIECGGDATLF